MVLGLDLFDLQLRGTPISIGSGFLDFGYDTTIKRPVSPQLLSEYSFAGIHLMSFGLQLKQHALLPIDPLQL